MFSVGVSQQRRQDWKEKSNFFNNYYNKLSFGNVDRINTKKKLKAARKMETSVDDEDPDSNSKYLNEVLEGTGAFWISEIKDKHVRLRKQAKANENMDIEEQMFTQLMKDLRGESHDKPVEDDEHVQLENTLISSSHEIDLITKQKIVEGEKQYLQLVQVGNAERKVRQEKINEKIENLAKNKTVLKPTVVQSNIVVEPIVREKKETKIKKKIEKKKRNEAISISYQNPERPIFQYQTKKSNSLNPVIYSNVIRFNRKTVKSDPSCAAFISYPSVSKVLKATMPTDSKLALQVNI